MGSPLKDHVTPLLQALVYELVARLCGFTRFATSGQENPAFLVLYRHEVRRYLDVDDVGAVRMRAEVVHEQVMRIVDKEVQGVDHLAVVANQGHFDRLLNHF